MWRRPSEETVNRNRKFTNGICQVRRFCENVAFCRNMADLERLCKIFVSHLAEDNHGQSRPVMAGRA